MDIRFYDWEGKFLCILPKMQSVNWYIYYNRVGTVEIHLNVGIPQAKELLDNKYILSVAGKLQAVIVIKKIDKHELILYGRTLNWLLGKRVVTPPEEKSKNIINEVIKCIPEYMTVGSVPVDVKIAEDIIDRTNAETAEAAVVSILKLANLGHEVRYLKGTDGNAAYVFNILEGKESEIVLAEELRNVHEIIYTDDMLDYCTVGYYLKEDAWTEVIKDKAKEGIYRFEGVLSSENRTDAINELNDLRWMRICEGKMRTLKYGKDYDLGDFVTIKYKRGDFQIATKYRVTGVHIWYEGDGEGEEPVFEEVIG